MIEITNEDLNKATENLLKRIGNGWKVDMGIKLTLREYSTVHEAWQCFRRFPNDTGPCPYFFREKFDEEGNLTGGFGLSRRASSYAHGVFKLGPEAIVKAADLDDKILRLRLYGDGSGFDTSMSYRHSLKER